MKAVEYMEKCEINDPELGLIDFKLYDYQKEFIEKCESNDKVICISSRQMGKSSMMFLYAFYKAEQNENYNILFFSYRGSIKHMFDKFYHLIPNRPINDCISFKNGSKIKFIDNKNSLIGVNYKCDMKIYDEYDFIDYDLLEISESYYSKKIIKCSTRKRIDGKLVKEFSKAKDGASDFVPHTISWDMNEKNNNVNWLYKTMTYMTPDSFSLEYGPPSGYR